MAKLIKEHGGEVGEVVTLEKNCIHPETIRAWQGKGYNYRRGFCSVESCCERKGDPDVCPFLESIDELKTKEIICVTKERARRPGFFNQMGNDWRKTIVIDEDPISTLRPAVEIGREELEHFLETIEHLITDFCDQDFGPAENEAKQVKRAAKWLWERMREQKEPNGDPVPVDIPNFLPTKAVLLATKKQRKVGRAALEKAFWRKMREDPIKTVRNVLRDVNDLARHAVSKKVFVTSSTAVFHLNIKIPRDKEVIVLDATANPTLLAEIVRPRPVEVLGDQRVRPEGRVVQLLDSNGPRSYLNKAPKKVVRIIDAIGDLHPKDTIVLISHKSCVDALKDESTHKDRIRTAYFGALRGRNDLEPSKDNRIACHIVIGSPKTTEADRQHLALAVYGESILPFPKLKTVQRGVVGRVPREWAESDEEERIWKLRLRGYHDPRMQAVYEHTVTAELTHAADRARVLIHDKAMVYLVTNEPCPKLWFAEKCLVNDFLDLYPPARADWVKNFSKYGAKAKELLDAGGTIGNADVCRALGMKPGWGKRYWTEFVRLNGDALEGTKKFKWKQE